MQKEILLTNDVDLPPAHILAAGNFELLYEHGRVRYIKYNGEEVLRMIYPALRAADWATIDGKITDEKIATHERGFEINYSISYHQDVITYKASFRIICSDNILEFSMNGEALSDFSSKRIGLCIHHPIRTCAGQEVHILHPENTLKTYSYPELIAATWPFTDIRHMRWNTPNNLVELSFAGDLFETEDQRNWTDDSFKTYTGPQYKTPMLEIKAGDKSNQTVTLSVTAVEAAFVHPIENVAVKHPFPKIGYSRSGNLQELTDEVIKLSKNLPFNHYRAVIDLNDAGWKCSFADLTDEADRLNTSLELSVYFNSTGLREFISEVTNTKVKIECIHILETAPTPSEDFYNDIYSQLKYHFPEIKSSFGNSGWFADINACDIENISSDAFNFMVSPQVHQSDERSILENLGSQSDTIRTLRKRAGKTPIFVSPLVFNSREDDTRLHSEFAAWWTINAICNFAGADYITLYELSGPRGILDSPVYHLLRTIKEFDPVFIYKINNRIVLENASKDTLIYKSSLYE